MPADEARHARRVLRLESGAQITVTDGSGRIARAALAEGSDDPARLLEEVHEPRPTPHVVVYQGEAKGHKLDEVVGPMAELGVAELWTFSSERSVVRWDDLKRKRLTQRWGSIARGASKQSRNPHLLSARPGLGWDDLVTRIRSEPMAVTLWEEASLPLRAVLPPHVDRIALVIGPEGGLTRTEAEALADVGAPLASLGPRILRTENAPVVAAAVTLYHFGLIG